MTGLAVIAYLQQPNNHVRAVDNPSLSLSYSSGELKAFYLLYNVCRLATIDLILDHSWEPC